MLVHWIWLSLLPGMNGRKKLELLQRYGGAEEIYHLDVRTLQREENLSVNVRKSLLNKELEPAQKILRDCSEKGIGILAFPDTTYPDRLRSIDDPPLVLYYRGQLPALELQPVIGIVGTRKASPYGLRSAATMGAQIAACGGIVASGGATGIDTMALQGALDAGKKTVTVLAGGLDKLYPASNKQLFSRVLEKGCLLSEYPPGVPSYPGNFLRRNRIISGISNGVLVVEAPSSSGALNTARWAWSQGRDVFAVPGNIDVEVCAGSNRLIGDIAHAALSGWAVVKEYEALYPDAVKQAKPDLKPETVREVPLAQSTEKPALPPETDKINVDNRKDCPYIVKEKPIPALSAQEKEVAAVLTKEPVPVDQVIDRLGMSPAQVLSVITRLSLKGVAQTHPGKFVSLK